MDLTLCLLSDELLHVTKEDLFHYVFTEVVVLVQMMAHHIFQVISDYGLF